MEQDKKIALIILAAGESKRMKGIKQLLPWKGTTLLGHAIDQGIKSKADNVFVVIGAQTNIIKDTIRKKNFTYIHNSNWLLGIGSSIASAMNYFINNSLHFEAVLFVLIDQPLIDFTHYNKLINNYIVTDKIIATKFKSGVGVPAILGEKYFGQLLQLNADFGAKKIIKSNLNDVLFISKEGKVKDIDTRAAYKIHYNLYGR